MARQSDARSNHEATREMNDPFLLECWSLIGKREKEIQSFPFQPLAHLESALVHFNLQPLQEGKIEPGILPDISTLEPNFKGLTDDMLMSLRQQIYAENQLDFVARWAETLLRFCEVRYNSLKRRSVEKTGSLTAARLHLLHLASFLLDWSAFSKDLRFLNTVLKLADLSWLVDRRKLIRNLKQGNELPCSLFQFRVLLNVEYLLDLLKVEEL